LKNLKIGKKLKKTQKKFKDQIFEKKGHGLVVSALGGYGILA
jgi:hypothetical protein